jgi:hypothetical protein
MIDNLTGARDGTAGRSVTDLAGAEDSAAGRGVFGEGEERNLGF